MNIALFSNYVQALHTHINHQYLSITIKWNLSFTYTNFSSPNAHFNFSLLHNLSYSLIILNHNGEQLSFFYVLRFLCLKIPRTPYPHSHTNHLHFSPDWPTVSMYVICSQISIFTGTPILPILPRVPPRSLDLRYQAQLLCKWSAAFPLLHLVLLPLDTTEDAQSPPSP